MSETLKEWLSARLTTVEEDEGRIFRTWDDETEAVRMLSRLADPDPVLVERVAAELLFEQWQAAWATVHEGTKDEYRETAKRTLTALSAALMEPKR